MKVIKWFIIIGAGAVLVSVSILLLIPQFVDLTTYKPKLERMISDKTGRDITIGNDIALSLFPWAGFKISDLEFGNTDGFTEKNLLTAESLEVRVKLIPLLSKNIQAKQFILKNPRIVLERLRNGKANWETDSEKTDSKKKESADNKIVSATKGLELPFAALSVEEFDINGGSVFYTDHSGNIEKELNDISIKLVDLSLDKPVKLNISATADGLPIKLEGSIGPAGQNLFAQAVPFEIKATLKQLIDLNINGKIDNILVAPAYTATINIPGFSPSSLSSALGRELPQIHDKDALKTVSIDMDINGNPDEISLTRGRLKVDDTTLDFTAAIKEMSKPNITFDIALDAIDLDRYLPEDKTSENSATAKTAEINTLSAQKKTTMDFTQLRKIKLKGSLTAGMIKIKGIRADNLSSSLSGANGVFKLNPLKMNFYGGTTQLSAVADFKGSTPKTSFSLDVKDINTGPLLRDVAKKDFMEGKVQAKFQMEAQGTESAAIKKTLNGKGQMTFNDGAIKGIDLSNMVRNVQTAFGIVNNTDIEPSTEFTSLIIPLTIKKGVADISGTKLNSPLLQVKAKGSANLVKETLKIRVEPLFVAVLSDQKKSQQNHGVKVPILITGTFDSPVFMPDMEETLKNKLFEIIESPDKKSAETHIKDIFKSFIQ